MVDRFDHDPIGRRAEYELEAKRIAFAAARVADHAERELWLLDAATRAGDDEHARELEFEADEAYRDIIALAEEHGLVG